MGSKLCRDLARGRRKKCAARGIKRAHLRSSIFSRSSLGDDQGLFSIDPAKGARRSLCPQRRRPTQHRGERRGALSGETGALYDPGDLAVDLATAPRVATSVSPRSWIVTLAPLLARTPGKHCEYPRGKNARDDSYPGCAHFSPTRPGSRLH